MLEINSVWHVLSDCEKYTPHKGEFGNNIYLTHEKNEDMNVYMITQLEYPKLRVIDGFIQVWDDPNPYTKKVVIDSWGVDDKIILPEESIEGRHKLFRHESDDVTLSYKKRMGPATADLAKTLTDDLLFTHLIKSAYPLLRLVRGKLPDNKILMLHGHEGSKVIRKSSLDDIVAMRRARVTKVMDFRKKVMEEISAIRCDTSDDIA